MQAGSDVKHLLARERTAQRFFMPENIFEHSGMIGVYKWELESAPKSNQ
jgi:hypothetical protein